MTEKTRAELTRERLLESAIDILQTDGMNQFTLDAVARQAEVSKGGLLHHFPSKDALIDALLRYLLNAFDVCAQQHYDADPHPQGRWARAYLQASFNEQNDLPFSVLVTLYVHVAGNETLQAIVQEDLRMWEDRFAQDGIAPEKAAIIRLVCDAHWTERSTGIQSRVPVESLMQTLLSFIE